MDQELMNEFQQEKARVTSDNSNGNNDVIDDYLYPKASTYGHFYENQPFFNEGTINTFNKLQLKRREIKKYQEFVVAVPSLAFTALSDDPRKQSAELKYFWQDAPNGFNHKITSLGKVDGYVSETAHPFTDLTKSIAEHGMFEIIPRAFLEENLSYVQLVSVVVLTDVSKTRFIMLRNTSESAMDNRLTFVQGHVAYDKSIYTTNAPEFLMQNAVKELHEELDMDESAVSILKGATTPASRWYATPETFLVYSKEDLISHEHIGIVHVINLGQNFENFANHVKTKEPQNHEVEVLPIGAASHDNGLDAWSRIILEQLAQR